jgi:uncharacterized tellurite resistance protein B-like protein
MTPQEETLGSHEGVEVLPNVFEPAADRAQHVAFDFQSLVSQTGYLPATDWTIPEAFLCLILAAASADGVVPPEEHMEIKALARRSRVLKSLDAGELARTNHVLALRMKQRPRALQEACQTLPADMRPSIFAHCADILLADGSLAQAEAEFLNRIMSYLQLDELEARRQVEALLIKNRY